MCPLESVERHPTCVLHGTGASHTHHHSKIWCVEAGLLLLPLVHSTAFPRQGAVDGCLNDKPRKILARLAAQGSFPWQPTGQGCQRMGLDCLQETAMTLLTPFYEESGAASFLLHARAPDGKSTSNAGFADLFVLQPGHSEAVQWLQSLQASLEAAAKSGAAARGPPAKEPQPQVSPSLVLMLAALLSHPAASVQVLPSVCLFLPQPTSCRCVM